jgi:hypothetical protein
VNPVDLEVRKRELVAGVIFGALLGFSILLAAALTGCSAGPYYAARTTLATTARTMAAVDHELAQHRLETSDRITADPASTLAEHRAAMQPYDEALAVSLDVRDSLLAAQAAVDAAEKGEREEWLPMLGCVTAAVERLYALLRRRGLFEPDATLESVLNPLLEVGAQMCPSEEAQ